MPPRKEVPERSLQSACRLLGPLRVRARARVRTRLWGFICAFATSRVVALAHRGCCCPHRCCRPCCCANRCCPHCCCSHCCCPHRCCPGELHSTTCPFVTAFCNTTSTQLRAPALSLQGWERTADDSFEEAMRLKAEGTASFGSGMWLEAQVQYHQASRPDLTLTLSLTARPHLHLLLHPNPTLPPGESAAADRVRGAHTAVGSEATRGARPDDSLPAQCRPVRPQAG